MERTRALRIFGTIGLAAGIAAMVGGGFAGELGGFMTGYGLLIVLSATYLLLGLAVRSRLATRARPAGQSLPAAQVIR